MEQADGVCVSGLVRLRQATFDRGRSGRDGADRGLGAAARGSRAFAREQAGNDMIHR